VHGFPIVGWHHFDCIPGAAIKKRAIGTFAYAFLATDAEIGINFNAPEWRMIFVGYPEHARFDGTILDASRRTGTSGATVRRYRQYSWPLLAGRFAVAL
jgi:hypothetical protein